jgi:hypothetical protein
VVIHARGQASLPVLQQGRGHRDDRCSAGDPLTAANLGRGLVAIQDRQLAVHQHQPVTPLQHQVHRLLAIADNIGAIPEPGEDGHGHRLIDLIVLYEEDPRRPLYHQLPGEAVWLMKRDGTGLREVVPPTPSKALSAGPIRG